MDVIPLDATLVKGSHGSLDVNPKYYPLIITSTPLNHAKEIDATEVYNIIWQSLNK
jgi:hypothetical protein